MRKTRILIEIDRPAGDCLSEAEIDACILLQIEDLLRQFTKGSEWTVLHQTDMQ